MHWLCLTTTLHLPHESSSLLCPVTSTSIRICQPGILISLFSSVARGSLRVRCPLSRRRSFAVQKCPWLQLSQTPAPKGSEMPWRHSFQGTSSQFPREKGSMFRGRRNTLLEQKLNWSYDIWIVEYPADQHTEKTYAMKIRYDFHLRLLMIVGVIMTTKKFLVMARQIRLDQQT